MTKVIAKLFLFVLYVSKVHTTCVTISNVPSTYGILEDTEIGGYPIFVWQTNYDSSWGINQSNDSFVTAYFITSDNNATLRLMLNVTGSTDLEDDFSTICKIPPDANVTLFCQNFSKVLHVEIIPQNDRVPEQINTQDIPTEIREDRNISEPLVNFGPKFKDSDCPRQNLLFYVNKPDIANSDDYLDGSKYFSIYENGTLYLKTELDYETTVCSVAPTTALYLDLIVKDDGSPSQQFSTSLGFTIINVDDTAPKFIDPESSCKWACSLCEVTSFIGNVSYENQGNITVHPQIFAVDVEEPNASVVYYISSVFPGEYQNIILIDDSGQITLNESFQNVTNNTVKDDFSVLVYIKAISNRTMLETKNAALNLTIYVPPETTTIESTTVEQTTTELVETTDVDTTTTILTTTEIKTTKLTTPLPTTPMKTTGNEKKSNDPDIIVIIVPIVGVLVVIVIAVVIYTQRKTMKAKRYKYRMEKEKHNSIETNGIPIDKVEP